jgi:antitoxin component of MazEF toxin-antitoxin module
MPIKRKICKIGNGYAVFVPKSWVQLLREKHQIDSVTVEVNGTLKIKPILKRKKEAV